jgi:hypothetical protein
MDGSGIIDLGAPPRVGSGLRHHRPMEPHQPIRVDTSYHKGNFMGTMARSKQSVGKTNVRKDRSTKTAQRRSNPRSSMRPFEDPEVQIRFERTLSRLKKKSRPLIDALRSAERLNEEDFAICVNARG